jgi:hypothetical protein
VARAAAPELAFSATTDAVNFELSAHFIVSSLHCLQRQTDANNDEKFFTPVRIQLVFFREVYFGTGYLFVMFIIDG